MRYKVIVFIFLLFGFFFVPSANAQSGNFDSEKLARQIEILKHEIGVLLSLITNARLPGAIASPSYVAVNLADNSLALSKNPDTPQTIASITKLMTAVVASEQANLDNKITLNSEILRPLGESPVLFKGLRISGNDLLRAALIQSSNDAAEALAHFKGKDDFVNLMNQKATEIGMTNSHFYEPTGLDPKNTSTARDLSKLVNYVHKNHPGLLATSRDNDFWLPDESGVLLKFQNVNNFYPLAAFVGGKTGYLPQARQSIASVFRQNGQDYAVVVLSSTNRQGDVFKILEQLK